MAKIIVWSPIALSQIKSIYEYILDESGSVKIANKVIDKIVLSTKIILQQPKIYPADKFKYKNKGDYRAYEVYNYRIAYRILKDEIRILRVRHTSQEPLIY